MSLARLKRLQRLEARRPRGRPWFDPFDTAMRLFEDLQAVASGKAEWVPLYGPDPAPSSAFLEAMALADRTAARLAAEGAL